MTAAEKSVNQIGFPLCCLRVPREIKPIVCVCVCVCVCVFEVQGLGLVGGWGEEEREGEKERGKERNLRNCFTRM